MLQEPKATTETFRGPAVAGEGSGDPDDAGASAAPGEDCRAKHVELTRLSAPTFKTSLRRSFIDGKRALRRPEAGQESASLSITSKGIPSFPSTSRHALTMGVEPQM